MTFPELGDFLQTVWSRPNPQIGRDYPVRPLLHLCESLECLVRTMCRLYVFLGVV